MIDRSVNDMQKALGPFTIGPTLFTRIVERLLE